MRRIKFMIKNFLNEPLWFKVLILITLLASIVLSSSFFSSNNLQGYSKLAAAIFFGTFAIKFRRNFRTAFILLACTVICIFLFLKSIN